MKVKLLLITVLALGGLAHAQGFASKLSLGVGFEGIFPAATFTRSTALTNGAANTQSTSNTVGIVGDARYDFGHHSALDVAVTVNRNTEYFLQSASGSFNSSFLNHVQTNNVEIIGSYIFRLPSNEYVKPYALLGGGFVHFSPNNAFNTPVSPSTDTKPTFAYGFGTDFKLSERWGVRLQYRGLIRSEPDFKLMTSGPFGTGLKTHVPEPSLQLVYRF